MPRMILKETGVEVDIPYDSMDYALSSGRYDFVPDETYTLVNEHGYKSTYTGANIDEGFRRDSGVVSGAAIYDEALQSAEEDKYGGVLNSIEAGVQGALRGASFGFSDAALAALGADTEHMSKLRQYNPTAATAGEIVGAVAPALLTGGSSAAASGGRLASTAATAGKILRATPAGLAARAGTRIAGLGAEAGLIGRGAAAVAGGAVEGGLFGAGAGISELALSDKPLSAERIVSTIGSSALTGAAFGGAVGAASVAVPAVYQGAKKVISGAGKKSGTLFDKVVPPKIQSLFGKGDDAEQVLLKLRKSVTDDLGDFRLAAKEIRREAAKVQKAATNIDNQWGAGSFASIHGEGATAGNLASKLDNLNAAQKKLDDVFAPWTEVDAGEKYVNFLEAFQAKEGKELTEAIVASGKYIEAAEELRNIAVVKSQTGGVNVPTGTLKGLEKLAEKQAAAATSKWGLKEWFGVLDVLGVVDEGDIPVVGPYLKKFPFLGEILLLNGGSKWMKGGPARAALKAWDNGGIATSKAAQSAAKASNRVQAGVKKFVSGASKTKKAAIPGTLAILNSAHFAPTEQKKYGAKTPQDAYKRRSDELMKMAANPRMVEQLVANSLGPVPEDVIKAVQQVQIRKVQFLADKLPKDPTGHRILGKEFKPNNIELKKFARYMRAAEDPVSVLEDMSRGRLTQEAAETIKAVYPRMYADIQEQLMVNLPKLREDLSYKQRLQLSRLFGVPVDESMEPAFIQAMQADYAEAPQEGASGGVKPSATSLQEFKAPAMAPTSAIRMSSMTPGER